MCTHPNRVGNAFLFRLGVTPGLVQHHNAMNEVSPTSFINDVWPCLGIPISNCDMVQLFFLIHVDIHILLLYFTKFHTTKKYNKPKKN